MKTLDQNSFEHDYILTLLEHYRIDLASSKSEPQITDKYACILTSFMAGQINMAIDLSHATKGSITKSSTAHEVMASIENIKYLAGEISLKVLFDNEVPQVFSAGDILHCVVKK